MCMFGRETEWGKDQSVLKTFYRVRQINQHTHPSLSCEEVKAELKWHVVAAFKLNVSYDITDAQYVFSCYDQ